MNRLKLSSNFPPNIAAWLRDALLDQPEDHDEFLGAYNGGSKPYGGGAFFFDISKDLPLRLTVEAAERLYRDWVYYELRGLEGASWTSLLPEKVRGDIKARRSQVEKASIEDLAYCDAEFLMLPELATIILTESLWAKRFKLFFKTQDTLKRHFEGLVYIRNSISHHRHPTPLMVEQLRIAMLELDTYLDNLERVHEGRNRGRLKDLYSLAQDTTKAVVFREGLVEARNVDAGHHDLVFFSIHKGHRFVPSRMSPQQWRDLTALVTFLTEDAFEQAYGGNWVAALIPKLGQDLAKVAMTLAIGPKSPDQPGHDANSFLMDCSAFVTRDAGSIFFHNLRSTPPWPFYSQDIMQGGSGPP